MESGVYKIVCSETAKVYIGSSMNIQRRWLKHLSDLKCQRHKNKFLLRDFLQFGKEAFSLEILELCSVDQLQIMEQKWIDTISNLYNIQLIVGDITTLPLESKQQAIRTSIATEKLAAGYYKQLRSGEIQMEDIPIHLHNRIKAYQTRIVWNKGQSYTSTDHLKVPKKNKSEAFYEKYRQMQLEKAAQLLPVEVYTKDGLFLGSWVSVHDLEKWTIDTPDHNLPLDSRFKCEYRRGVYFKTLQAVNIAKAARTGKTYKGLHFKYTAPITSDGNSELGEFGEPLQEL